MPEDGCGRIRTEKRAKAEATSTEVAQWEEQDAPGSQEKEKVAEMVALVPAAPRVKFRGRGQGVEGAAHDNEKTKEAIRARKKRFIGGTFIGERA